MRSAVAEYLKTYESFELFGPSHWMAIFLFIFLLIWLPWYGRKHLESKEQDMICKVLSILIFINYPVWVLLESIGGTFNVKLHLPFHLCRFANLMVPFVLIRRNEFMFQILYFWGLSGMLQGIISPDIVQDFPHFHYFRFFIGHHLLVVAIIYMVVIYDMKPTLLGLKNAFIGMNLFLLLSFIVNILLDANYFWIMEKPPAGSLLDFMGPWPWYIVTGEFVALAHFGLFFLIYKFMKPNPNHA